MHITSILKCCFAIIVLTIVGCVSTPKIQSKAEIAPVVFVCEHGNVKSLIAASLFNSVSKTRGLPFRAKSRGLAPETNVPPKIVEALRGEGADVANYKPASLSAVDVSSAERVIAIGVDLSPFNASARTPIETWNDVPPASIDFPASRSVLLQHINVLLSELQSERN